MSAIAVSTVDGVSGCFFGAVDSFGEDQTFSIAASLAIRIDAFTVAALFDFEMVLLDPGHC